MTELEIFVSTFLKEDTTIKNNNLKVYSFLKHSKIISISSKRLEEIRNCGTFIKYGISSTTEQKKVLYMETCNHRFCARCQKNESLKRAIKLYTISNFLRLKRKRVFLFITLTVRNCKRNELRDTISLINKAFDKMMRRKIFMEVKGYVSKIEVTYNRKRDDFHPHMHLLFSMDSGYFSKENENYIKRDDLLLNWQSVTGDDNITQVDIRALKNQNDEKLIKSIQEVAKYEAKSFDFGINQEVFESFYLGLHSAKTFRYGGEFKEISNLYDVDEFGIFENYKPKNEKNGVWDYKTVSSWIFTKKEYETMISKLTKEEQKILEKQEKVKSYAQFKTKMKRLCKKIVDDYALLGQYFEKVRLYESAKNANPYRIRIRIEHLERKIKSTKSRIARYRVLINLYETFEREYKNNFKRKK